MFEGDEAPSKGNDRAGALHNCLPHQPNSGPVSPRALRVAGVPGPFRNPALDPTLGAGFRHFGAMAFVRNFFGRAGERTPVLRGSGHKGIWMEAWS